MAHSAPEPQFFDSFDGVRLAWREIGEGRPLVLIHGLFSNGYTNWIRYGHAARIAEQGYRVLLPDLRGHGDSAAPHDAAAYPPDALALDGVALVRHLGLSDYDLGGYSLGARTSLRMVVAQGMTPARLVLCGMGLEGTLHTGGRVEYFHRVLEGVGTHVKFSSEWMSEAFLKTTGGDPAALIHVLDTFVDTSREQLAAIAQPTCIICGKEDHDNGSAAELADVVPHARLVEIPGNHMSAVTRPELGEAIAAFLAA